MTGLRCLVTSILLSTAVPAIGAPVLLISIDGLHPDYVMNADRYQLRIPNLRRFVKEGAFARGVVAAVPTVTYPNHTTMVTGVAPVEHGILSNTPFDPLNNNREGWYWYAEDIRTPTLWSVADAAGLTTASVNWPVTVGERHVKYLLPEFWRASTAEDLKLQRALSQPADLQQALETTLGTPFVDGYIDTLAADVIRTRFSVELLRQHAPQLMAVHLIALDGIEHLQGPFVAQAFATLEALDGMIGELVAAATARNPATVVAIVSDHGFIATHTAVNLRTRFVAAGLIELADSSANPFQEVKAWQAQVWSGGAVAAIVLREPGNADVRRRVAKLLEELHSDPRHGIARVLPEAQISKLGAFSGAHYLVEFAPGFYLGSAYRGNLLTAATSKGTHGYLPDRPEMHASFLIKGPGIAVAKDVGIVDMKQIAPTLAKILGVSMTSARQSPLPVEARR